MFFPGNTLPDILSVEFDSSAAKRILDFASNEDVYYPEDWYKYQAYKLSIKHAEESGSEFDVDSLSANSDEEHVM